MLGPLHVKSFETGLRVVKSCAGDWIEEELVLGMELELSVVLDCGNVLELEINAELDVCTMLELEL